MSDQLTAGSPVCIKVISVPISFDFSFAGVNLMLQLAKENGLGEVGQFEWGEDDWRLLCANGCVVSRHIG